MRGDLGRAQRLFRRRKYAEVIRLLEPQIFRFRESFSFYFLLGSSCLRTGDLSGSYSYLRRASQLKADDVPTLLGIAAIYLKRQEIPSAIEHWLQVQDIEPKNRFAARGLNFVKKNADTPHVAELVDSNRLERFVPGHSRFEVALPYIIGAIAVAAVLIFTVPLLITKVFVSHAPERQGLENLTLVQSTPLVATSGQFRYVLTTSEIRSTFDRMKQEFSDYDDNLAQRDINRLIGSNASEPVKEKARILQSYLQTPNFATIKGSFSYQDVSRDPYLYQNCYIDWKGMVSNLKVTSSDIRFDFLVGYNDQKVLEGVVPVVLDFAADIRGATPLEVLGQVKLDGARMTLRGVSVHQLMPVSGS
jgi:hypothetical protein